MNTSLSEVLSDPAEWRTTLNSLAYKGITQHHIERWVWVLSAEDGDARIERFVSDGSHKPIFLLFQLLRRDETFRKGSSLISMCDYIAQHYCRSKLALDQFGPLPRGAIRRSLDNRLNMSPKQFAILLRLLVHHCIRIWPSAIVTLSRLVAQYIESIPAVSHTTTKPRKSGYQARCFIFNHALQLFESAPKLRPLAQARYNWRAQKVLLTLSTSLQTPLVINQMSYRAIRKVMLRLRKSDAEQKVATRLTKTWPPYRQEWDGMDERRRPEEDLSRSVQAGALMREAGYGDDPLDGTLGVLGGAVPDESPTIQTRSMTPRPWKGQYANQNVYSPWAAKIKTARNAQEAWNLFKAPPIEGLKPNFEVYAEMFAKLFAKEVDPTTAVLPGEGTEVFPVHDANLTEFEKARLQPPNPYELYKTMLHEGLRPVGHCLAALVKNAPTVQVAGHYLRDSPLDKKAVDLLTSFTVDSIPPTSAPSAASLLRKIPLAIVNAYISLLCRLQLRWPRGMEMQRKAPRDRLGHIQRAIRLAELRLPLNSRDGPDYKEPWHSILRALARSDIVLDPRGDLDARHNAMMTLSTFMQVFERVRSAVGLDVVLFEQLRRVLHKAVKSRLFEESNGPGDSNQQTASGSIVQRAHNALKTSFREITSASSSTGIRGGLEYPVLQHDVSADHLQGYIRTMGFLNDIDEMVFVMEWMLQSWDHDSVLEAAKSPDTRHHAMMSYAFTFFRAFAEHQVSADVMRRLENRLRQLNDEKGCTWLWPTEEEVESYVLADRSRDADKFWAMVHRQQDVCERAGGAQNSMYA